MLVSMVSSVPVLVSVSWLAIGVRMESTTGRTQVERKILRPLPVCTTAVAPPMVMNVCGPVHFPIDLRYIYTVESASSCRSFAEISRPFGPENVWSTKANLLRGWILSTSFIPSLIVACSCVWVAEEAFRPGLGIAPNTRRTVKSFSGQVVKLTEKISI